MTDYTHFCTDFLQGFPHLSTPPRTLVLLLEKTIALGQPHFFSRKFLSIAHTHSDTTRGLTSSILLLNAVMETAANAGVGGAAVAPPRLAPVSGVLSQVKKKTKKITNEFNMLIQVTLVVKSINIFLHPEKEIVLNALEKYFRVKV